MVNIFVKISNFFYRLKCKYWSKYSTIKPSTLKDNVYQHKSTVLIHSIFQILSECSFDEDDELSKIQYWWKNIFLPKSSHLIHNVFLIQMVEHYDAKRFNRLLNQSNSIMDDLYSNLHIVIDNMERLK